MEEKSNRYISIATKKHVLARQYDKCANNPYSPALNLQDYQCLLWKYQDGTFDASGFQFDHIDEYSISSNNDVSNIQALCPNCHAVKTKKFMKNKKLFTTREMHDGRALMDIAK